MKHTIFISILLVTLVSACCDLRTKKIMDSAESLLQTKPDSCLAIMESIVPSDLKTKEERARYALLMSAAMDKNYIDVASDSLIKVAVDYYSVRNDQRRRMMANYYHGLILNNATDYTAAIIALEKAEKDAIALDDHLYAGLILRIKSEIYNLTINSQAAQEGLKEAIAHFKQLDNPDYAAYAELGLAIIYINSHDYLKAKRQR